MENLFCKADIRQAMRLRRNSLSTRRSHLAEKKALAALTSLIPGHGHILSYASFGSELCTWDMNFRLAAKKRLALPKVVGKNLRLYRVNNIETELTPSRLGILEPNPDLCERIETGDIALAIIPGLAFDPLNHRLGYGRGFYDRLLQETESGIHTLGIGFTEQKTGKPLPVEATDVPLAQIALF